MEPDQGEFLPGFFTEPENLLNYDFNLNHFLDNDKYDESFYIDNLTLPGDKKDLCESFFKSILFGYNHIYVMKILEKIGYEKNICLPIIHKWDNQNIKINNFVIISHPDDAERICKKHIKKAPNLKQLLNTSVISTTDNEDWKNQRQTMNMAFLPKQSLGEVFPISQKRANHCSDLLKEVSENYTKSVDMSDFFLNETQAQLQLAMFGFTDEFQEKTNKNVRNAFLGINPLYLETFAREAYQEILQSNGPLSEVIKSSSKDEIQFIGNILIFAFAGHDTTGHTLSWLLYELCKHPKYKQDLIQEIDEYWLNHNEETYGSFKELPFMTKCITETLRLWPALANGTYRELEYDEEIIGLNGEKTFVPKGTYCQIMNWTRHRNPDLWGDDVNIFNPYREFKDEEIWDYKGFGTSHVSSERFSPFTYGPRHCVGKNFSQMEMRLILLNLFKNYDFVLDSKQKETINNPKYMGINTFTMGPQNVYDGILGMYVNVIPRKSKL